MSTTRSRHSCKPKIAHRPSRCCADSWAFAKRSARAPNLRERKPPTCIRPGESAEERRGCPLIGASSGNESKRGRMATFDITSAPPSRFRRTLACRLSTVSPPSCHASSRTRRRKRTACRRSYAGSAEFSLMAHACSSSTSSIVRGSASSSPASS